MKALFFHGNRDLRFKEIDCPEPGEGEVRLLVTDAGLSQATVAEFIEGPFIVNTDPHPRTGQALPVIPCQEFGGEIDKIGEGVDASLMGKTGAVLPLLPCGTCAHCQASHENLCTTLAYRGLVGAHGGFVEQIVIPVEDFFEVTPNIMPNLVEPLLVAVHAIEQLKRHNEIEKESSVLILGAGCIGICLASILEDIYGVKVIISDPLKERLERAARIGFETLEFDDLGASENAFPVVIDAAGKDQNIEQQALDQAIDLCAAGGTIVAVGTYFISLEILPARFLFQEITILPSFAYNKNDVKELERIQAKLKTDLHHLLTHVQFADIIDEGFYAAELDRNAFTRITTSPSQAKSDKIAA